VNGWLRGLAVCEALHLESNRPKTTLDLMGRAKLGTAIQFSDMRVGQLRIRYDWRISRVSEEYPKTAGRPVVHHVARRARGAVEYVLVERADDGELFSYDVTRFGDRLYYGQKSWTSDARHNFAKAYGLLAGPLWGVASDMLEDRVLKEADYIQNGGILKPAAWRKSVPVSANHPSLLPILLEADRAAQR
jgi:hypothetical protein